MWTEQADDVLPEQDVETEAEPEAENFEDLEPEVLERVNRYAAAQVDAERQRLETARTALRQRGMDLADDGSPVIRDPQTAGSWLGTNLPPPVVPVAKAAPEPEGDPPDIYTDPAGYNAWVRAEVQRQVKEANSQQYQPLADRQAQQERIFLEREAEYALGRVGDALATYSPWLQDIVQHPEFEAQFKQTLLSSPIETWQDPRNLASLAGMLVPHMDLSKVRTQPQRLRDPGGRYTPTRGQMARNTLAQIAPSRGAGSPSRQAPRDEATDQLTSVLMKRSGGTKEIWDAVRQDETIEGYRAAKKAAQKR